MAFLLRTTLKRSELDAIVARKYAPNPVLRKRSKNNYV